MFCKLFVKDNWNTLLGVNPMGISSPGSDYLDVIALQPVKIYIYINPISISAPLEDSLDIIALEPVRK